jgi:phospholipid N-methyltransferase
MKIAMGYMAAKHLFAASQSGLFEALAAGPSAIDDLAQKTGVPARTLAIIANTMVSIGLIERQGNHYKNGEAAAAFLAGSGAADLRPMLRYMDKISYPRWQKFGEAVQAGHGQVQFEIFNPTEQQLFSEGVEAFTTPMARALATSYDFSKHQRILDIAGGTGSFLIAILQRHRTAKAALFELPGACVVARKNLSRHPERSRIDLIEGDMFKDQLPEGYDALIVANTVHVLSVDHNIELMNKMRASVKPGAQLLLVDMWTDPTHSQPTPVALLSGEFLVMSGEGQAYSEQEVVTWLEQTGWRRTEHKPLAWPASLIVAEAD